MRKEFGPEAASRHRGPKVLIISLAFLLAASLVLQSFPSRDRVQRFDGHLLANTRIPGWDGVDVSLSATEAGQADVKLALGYDDYFYRLYTKGTTRVSLLVIHWGATRGVPGGFHSHTPDGCFPANGWTAIEANDRLTMTTG